MSLAVQLLVRLRHMKIILFISRHVNDLIGNPGIFRIAPVNLSVRCLHKAVFIDPRIGSKSIDKTNVRTFRCLNGAHSPVMRIMHVADLKSGTIPGKTSGTKG